MKDVVTFNSSIPQFINHIHPLCLRVFVAEILSKKSFLRENDRSREDVIDKTTILDVILRQLLF